MPDVEMKKIKKPFYPIVYVRGYAMRASEREETYYDTYYGFAATSVEKRDALPPKYYEADVFEGQLIRLMKLKDYSYADAVNTGLEDFYDNPSRSIWVCRFYDMDHYQDKIRTIEEHAQELYDLVLKTIPERLKLLNVDLGPNLEDYKVILIAHSMGGLVCRTFIQNLLPTNNKDPKDIVYRLVTMGTPHGGIDMGILPDVIEDFATNVLNPYGSNIFKEKQMRNYLKLNDDYDIFSLGDETAKYAYPVKRCLTIIGSDYQSYNLVRKMTGGFSDGLVKQDRAYVVTGKKMEKYPPEKSSYWANVHRAHSGRRGIVNSYESFENLQRFLFGNIKADIYLTDINIKCEGQEDFSYFYDFEYLLSIRKTNVYLHRREQRPCENAVRIKLENIPEKLYLHTLFMNSSLKDTGSNFSHFMLKIKIVEHRVKDGFLWDTEYPEKPIFNETVEVRIGDADKKQTGR